MVEKFLAFLIFYFTFVILPFIGGISGILECYQEFKNKKIVQGCFTLSLAIFLLIFEVAFFWLFLFKIMLELLHSA
jgi:hypothetical protein